MKKSKKKSENIEEFNSIIKDLVSNSEVLRMREFRQHCDTNCFDHCYMAAYHCYNICKKFNLDYKSAARAAMLHDLFLYDWRIKNGRTGLHAFTHPKVACMNASKLFDLNDKEKNMILCHMWPLTVKLPKYKEGFVLTLVDKYAAISEGVMYFFRTLKKNEVLRYAYLLFITFRINR